MSKDGDDTGACHIHTSHFRCAPKNITFEEAPKAVFRKTKGRQQNNSGIPLV